MLPRIQAWFRQQAEPLLHAKPGKRTGKHPVEEPGDLRAAIERMDENAMHALRKSAKLCRYMAESDPGDAALRQIAERYEALQEAGGKWHDWLLLTQLAGRFHGRKSDLSLRYHKHRDAALAEYRLRLADLLPVLMA